jgi:hypothetical protein
MYLERMFAVFHFETLEEVQAFVKSDEVRRSRFGEAQSAPPTAAPMVQFIQPDGFRIVAAGFQIQAHYELPTDSREMGDTPFDQIASRMRRLTDTITRVTNGHLSWVGVQVYLNDPDLEAHNIRDAASHWLQELQSPVFSKMLPIEVNLHLIFMSNDFFEGITVHSYERRSGSLPTPTPNTYIDAEKSLPVVEAGMQFVVDINTKPKQQHDPAATEFLAIIDRMKERYLLLINRGSDALLGKIISA